jgi:predicted oxidoreductase
MERISLNQDINLSRIVYGMWRLGDDANTSPEHVRAKIDASLDQGITSFDQADIYGGYEAEEILGNALSGTALRNKM